MSICKKNDVITIQISAEKYWGFNFQVEKKKFVEMDIYMIIKDVKIRMYNFFNKHNLLELRDGVESLKITYSSKNQRRR